MYLRMRRPHTLDSALELVASAGVDVWPLEQAGRDVGAAASRAAPVAASQRPLPPRKLQAARRERDYDLRQSPRGCGLETRERKCGLTAGPGGATHASPLHHAPSPNPERRRRRSIRLREFDYTQHGAYFVTICTQNRMCIFGDIVNGEMRVNDIGRVAQLLWDEIPAHFPEVETDAWVVMPNHVHGVLVITPRRGDACVAPPCSVRPAETLARRNRGFVQIRRIQTHQPIAPHPWGTGLAAQLLRPRYSQRRRPQPHSGIHRRKPGPVA